MSSSLLQCTESQRNAIYKGYDKTAETMAQDIQHAKEWMSKTSNAPEVADEKVIENFLLLNKCDLEKAKKKLEMYYRVRTIFPDLYNKNPNDPSVQKIMDVIYYIPLPKLTDELYRVVVIKAVDTNADNFDAILYLAHTLNVAEIRLREDCSSSEVQVYDLSGMQLGHFTKFTPGVIRKGTFVLEKVFSNRSKGLHYVNAPKFIGPFVTLLKLFLKPKLANRIYFHKDMESLYKVIPKEILPAEYGGNERSLFELNEEWKRKFLEYAPLFDHLQEIVSNECKQLPDEKKEDLHQSHVEFSMLEVD